MSDGQGQGTREGISADEVRRKHAEYLLPAVANYYEESLVLDRGEGMFVEDSDGKRYLDFFGGILTVSIGHCDERITGPLKAQIDRLGHVSSLYPTVPTVELAETLARITPGRLQKSIFGRFDFFLFQPWHGTQLEFFD